MNDWILIALKFADSLMKAYLALFRLIILRANDPAFEIFFNLNAFLLTL